MIEETFHGKLKAKKEGIYTVYVFQKNTGQYVMCTKLPNWGAEYNLQVGSSGYVTIQHFEAGEKYYERDSDVEKIVKHTNIYFKEFIQDTNQNQKIIL